MKRSNAGIECDMNDGPCACGAWHKLQEDREKKMEEMKRFYFERGESLTEQELNDRYDQWNAGIVAEVNNEYHNDRN